MAFSLSSATIFLLSVTIFTTLVSADNHLLPGERLRSGAFLTEKQYMLIMKEDCNLVLYNLNKLEWQSGTSNQGSRCYLTLQSDGNLVIYDELKGRNKAIWASNTEGDNGEYVLIVQKDGNVVIYGHQIYVIGPNRIASAAVVATKRNRKALFGVEEKIIEVTANL